MRTIRTEIEIDAPPSVVWEVLTDLPSYREWNPQIPDARGTLGEGETVELRVRGRGGRIGTLPVAVEAFDPPRRLRWVGTVLSTLAFRGRHDFKLEPLPGGRTRLVNRERVSGALVPLVLSRDAEAEYAAMNRALGARAERLAAQRPEAESDSTA